MRWIIPLLWKGVEKSCEEYADRRPARYTKAAHGEKSKSYVCLFSFAWFRHTAGLQHGSWTHFTGSGRFAALHHSAYCVQRCIKSNCFSLRWLHVGVIHRIFKWCLTIGALVADIAIELDLWACPKNKEKQYCMNVTIIGCTVLQILLHCQMECRIYDFIH